MDFINAEPTQPVQEEALQQQAAASAQSAYLQQQAVNTLYQKEFLDVLKHYTEDTIIHEDVKSTKWAIFGKTLPLTFLEEKDLPLIDMFNNVLRIDALTNIPAHKLTFEQSHQLDQTQLYFYLQAKRAIGTNQNKVNERTLQVTQIGQSISTQTMNTQQKQRNILSKLRGMI